MALHRGLERIASLYRMMERIHAIEVQNANGAVEDLLCAVAIATTMRASQIEDARDALATGWREGWQVAETTRGVIDRRMDQLHQIRAEREAELAEASRVHNESRLEMEQMERVVEKTRALAAVVESRRVQADSDDRFASRSAWLWMQRLQDSE